jgi:Ran GTPase-activating protein (RanGAP) involved in mRNA processing and transport
VDVDQIFGLRTLDNLRILQVYHMNKYPLQKLAKNPSLGKLTHLLCHPHALEDIEEGAYIRLEHVKAVARSATLKSLTHLRLRQSDMGDKGCAEIVNSGILKRLKVLDLRNGCVSDKGARTLAECPELSNLESLDLTRNCLTAAGIAVLQATGVNVSAGHQWQPRGDEHEDNQYLFEGDCE